MPVVSNVDIGRLYRKAISIFYTTWPLDRTTTDGRPPFDAPEARRDNQCTGARQREKSLEGNGAHPA
jgi:hypothetical protein